MGGDSEVPKKGGCYVQGLGWAGWSSGGTNTSVCWALGRCSGIGEIPVSQEETGEQCAPCVCVYICLCTGRLTNGGISGTVSSWGHHQ